MKQKNRILIVMFLFACLFGGFYEFSAMIMMGILVMYLVLVYEKKKVLKIPKSTEFIGIVIIAAAYVLTVFYGIDSGVSLSGVLKIFSIIVFYLFWNNTSDDEKSFIWSAIPTTGAAVTFLAIAVYPFENIRDLFYRAGRLGGTFQYSNTYALFLLIGLIVLLHVEMWRLKEKIEMAVLILGIIFSGSRSVVILGAVVLLLILIRKRSYKRMLFILPIMVVAIIIGGLFLDLDITRFLKMTVNSSTLNGRFLYWYDAIPVLWKHPFGLGYMGYYFLQPQIQSGNYVTKFVHNDFWQLGLDAGIIPMVIVLIIVGKVLVSKNVEVRQKIILSVLFLHSLFDFDMQFVLMAFVSVMCISNPQEPHIIIGKKQRNMAIPILATTGVISIYFAVAFGMAYLGQHDVALKLYPYNTFAREERMQMEEEKLSDAEIIIQTNGTLPDAYEARIQNKCENGMYDEILNDVGQMLDHAGYQADYYNQAVYYLSIALDNAIRSDDLENAQEILKAIQNIPDRIEKIYSRTSKLAYKINDKPEIELETSIQEYLDKVSNVTLEQN